MAFSAVALTDRGYRNIMRGEGSAVCGCVVCGALRPLAMQARHVPADHRAKIGFDVVAFCGSKYCASRIDAGSFTVRPSLRERITRG